jgi:hypothetical protein
MAFGLGRSPSTFDSKDFSLALFMPTGALLRASIITSMNWEFLAEPLSQGETPHCVGFSMANFGINLPIQTSYTNDDGHRFYYMCKKLDNDANPDGTPAETGSTVRSAAKVLKQLGKIDAYAFAPDMASIKWWILNKGPLIAGTIWTEDMFKPDADNLVHPTGAVAGGHAYLLNEWTLDNRIGIQNSWDDEWGKKGKAYITSAEFEKIFKYDGEALASVELGSAESVTTTNKGCSATIARFFAELARQY